MSDSEVFKNHVLNLSALNIVQDFSGSITFTGESAGYKNVLGMYEIMPDGSIEAIDIVFDNASGVGSGGDLIAGESKVDVEFSGGSTVGFFIIPNGAGVTTSDLINDGGRFEFRDSLGNVASTDSNDLIYLWHIAENGTETRMLGAGNGVTFHSYRSDDGSYNLNGDDINHTVYNLQQTATTATLTMGFEDIFRGGDLDFNDVMFEVDIGAMNMTQALSEGGMADLTVTDITLDQTVLEDGEHLNVNISIENMGLADAPQSSSVFYWSPTEVFDSRTAVALKTEGHGSLDVDESDHDESVQIRYDDLAENGPGWIFARIDDGNEITESDESNNVSDGVRFEMPGWDGQTDLTVTRIATDDSELSDGEDLFVTFDVENAGDIVAREVLTTLYWSETDTFNADTAVALSYDSQGSIKAGETDAGEVERIRFDSVAGLGSGFIFAVADGVGRIDESDESNNVSEGLAFTIDNWSGTAELRIDSLAFDTEAMDSTHDLIMNLNVANDGYVEAQSTATTYFWSETDTFDADTAVRLTSEHHGTLTPGEVHEDEVSRIRYEDVAALGDGFIFGVIDADNVFDEINEADNISEGLAFEIEATGVADLVISKFEAKDSSLKDGQDLFLDFSVENQGDLDAGKSATSVYWSETNTFNADTAVLIAQETQGSLDAGETETNESVRLRFEVLDHLGEGFLFGVTDADEFVFEGDETNNVSDAVAFTLPEDVGPMDLAIRSFGAEDVTLEDGQDLKVSMNVLNLGDGKAEDVGTTFYWSATDEFDIDTAIAVGYDGQGAMRGGEVDTGQSARLRYEELEDYGSGYLFGVVGASNGADEIELTNNISSALEFWM